MFIRTPERISWIQEQLNINSNHPNFSSDQKKQILRKTIEAVTFEKFLHTKYVGSKAIFFGGW
jgi:2-oxoglutarate dehydrogenase E1 component